MHPIRISKHHPTSAIRATATTASAKQYPNTQTQHTTPRAMLQDALSSSPANIPAPTKSQNTHQRHQRPPNCPFPTRQTNKPDARASLLIIKYNVQQTPPEKPTKAPETCPCEQVLPRPGKLRLRTPAFKTWLGKPPLCCVEGPRPRLSGTCPMREPLI